MKIALSVLAGILLFYPLYTVSTINYLAVHSLIELMAAVIAITIFSIGWNTWKFSRNSSLLILAVGYLVVAVLTLFHTMSFSGMGVFPGYDANTPTQFWIAARYVESMTLLIAALFLGSKKSIDALALLGLFLGTGVLLIYTILQGVFPDCFIEGAGLTTFKVVSEYVICGLLAWTGYIFWNKKHNLEKDIYEFILAAIVFTILAELSFTLYNDPYGFFNFLGHYFMLFSIVLLYLAFVRGSLIKPYAFMFNNIAERTSELGRINQALNVEIEERKRVELDLHKSEQQLRLFFEHMIAGVAIHEMIYDQNGNPVDYRFLEVNREFEALTGLKAAAVIGHTVKEVLPGTEPYWIDTYGRVTQTGEPLLFEQYSREIDKYFEVSAFSPKKNHFATVFVDVTERKKAQEHIRYIGYHDNLTDLYNRHYFEQCRKELQETPVLSVIMTDINGLKLINDTYGHAAGDELIKTYAELLRKSFKQGDLIFRWGGDEFIVILKNTQKARSWELCNRLVKHCGETCVKDIPLSVSVGISSKVRGGNIDQAIGEAEDLMYQHKLNESKSSKHLIMKTLLQTLSEKSYETREHIARMRAIGRQFGERLRLSPGELARLETLCMLHDIGKITIDRHILLSETALTAEEWTEIKKHPEVGYRITRTAEEFAYIAEEILAHHERWDGKGYPQGSAEENIPYLARILTLVDSYDVMGNGSPYQQKKSAAEIRAEIERCSGTQFDPGLAQEFIAGLREGSIGGDNDNR